MRVLEGNLISDQDVFNHWERMSSSDIQLKFDVSVLIERLKLASLWDKIAILCVVHDNQADSLLNLKGSTTGAPDSTLTTAVGWGVPSFVANRGFTCESGDPNGLAANNINFGVSEDLATGYGLYDSHFFTYCRTDSLLQSAVLAYHNSSGFDGNKIFTWDGPVGPGGIVQGGNVNIDFSLKPPADQKGFMLLVCDAINSRHFRVNDTYEASAINHSYVLETANTQVVLAKENESGTPYAAREHSAWGWGAAMSVAESATYENIMRSYMQARGADVY